MVSPLSVEVLIDPSDPDPSVVVVASTFVVVVVSSLWVVPSLSVVSSLSVVVPSLCVDVLIDPSVVLITDSPVVVGHDPSVVEVVSILDMVDSLPDSVAPVVIPVDSVTPVIPVA